MNRTGQNIGSSLTAIPDIKAQVNARTSVAQNDIQARVWEVTA